MKKTIVLIFSLLLLLAATFYFVLYPKLEIIAGYNAKILCSCIFVSHIPEDTATRIDLGFGPLWLATNSVDYRSKTVESSVWGLHPKKAIYRDGLGCTLFHNISETEVSSQKFNIDELPFSEDIWPEDDQKPQGALYEALASAFDVRGESLLNTRAVLVVKDGQLLGEMYGDGFDKHNKILGWSMMKSVNAALVGLLIRDGKWQLDQAAPVNLWKNDERSAITIRHLLNATSGLDWEEEYGSVSTATIMLYATDQMGVYASNRPLAHQPGSEWYYSSGTSNLLAQLVSEQFPDKKSYWNFAYERLFAPLGMRDFLVETDASGTHVGSSYGYGSARDWAKFALLFQQMGHWQGQQLLDTAYVEFCTTATETSGGRYGGQFWTNGHGKYKSYSNSDYWLDGFQGQQVSVHNDHGLVIVRLGVMYDEKNFDFDAWVGQIISATRLTEPQPLAIE